MNGNKPSRRVCTDWVEVTQADDVPLLLGPGHVLEQLLAKVLGPPVHVRHVAGRMVFGEREELRGPVDGARAGEHEVSHARLPHHL